VVRLTNTSFERFGEKNLKYHLGGGEAGYTNAGYMRVKNRGYMAV